MARLDKSGHIKTPSTTMVENRRVIQSVFLCYFNTLNVYYIMLYLNEITGRVYGFY